MHSRVYRERRKYMVYDSKKKLIIMYLNEKVIENYTPEQVGNEEPVAPYTGYQYTGTEHDGGCIVYCDNVDDRDALINSIIRAQYSETAEAAIKRHHMLLQDDASIAKADEYKEEWNAFNAWCDYAIKIYNSWLNDC